MDAICAALKMRLTLDDMKHPQGFPAGVGKDVSLRFVLITALPFPAGKIPPQSR